MDPETKQLLKENLELSKLNNQMLAKLTRSAKIANLTRIVYWGILILASLGAFYFIKPLLGNLLNLYGVSGVNNIGEFSNSFDKNKQEMQDFINAMK